ncbi:S-methyl-5-thioribose kinase [Proteocatella sphenisci]|uniref:S-methyl-5-thioribose kinase n=1 Tax=Proteocatella sphenisci TaxID=181070 RepID=UPI00048ECDA9|nr:S-methyl-5-thioribose kinase [Proteocatella sphenisci]
MSKFETYFLMNENEVLEYVREKLDIFAKDAVLTSKEIGDGNLNYVFRVKEEATGKSVIVKQAGGEARISADIKLSTDRTRIEAEILKKQGEMAPGLVPEVYLYDAVMCSCAMEDLYDYTIMRTALMNHEKFPHFADHISTFMVNTLLGTTDICVEHKAKKDDVKNYINPELCEISEDLVYTEPFNNIGNRNNVFPPIADFVQKELYEDKVLHLEAAKCKFEFMNNAQSLIHGDLHTGSIFINEHSTKIFDPEFAFYGPMGYDIGNVVANMFFAWNNGNFTIENEAEKADFTAWVEQSVEETIDMFIGKYNKFYDANVKDHMAKTPGFKEWYLDSILRDTASVTGLELARRIVGLANVKDITSISDENKRAAAEKICIITAKNLILNRDNFKTGKDFTRALKEAVAKITLNN